MENTHKIRVLLVEDSLVSQKVAELFLQHSNCEIDVASSGKVALEKMDSHFYDIVIMDLGLPDIDGFTVTRNIRTMEGNRRHTPIIALSAHISESYRKHCLRVGMDDFLPKPIDGEIADAILNKYKLLSNHA